LPVYLIRWVKDPDSCPLALLPWLAWEYQVDTWNINWSEQKTRCDQARPTSTAIVVRSPPSVMRPGGQSFGTDIVEWFNQNPKGDPYTFRLNVYQNDLPVTRIRPAGSETGGAARQESAQLVFRSCIWPTSGNLVCGRLHVRHGENHAALCPLQVVLSRYELNLAPGDSETVTVTILLNTRKIKPLR
jgi:phage tail P2-like protein